MNFPCGGLRCFRPAVSRWRWRKSIPIFISERLLPEIEVDLDEDGNITLPWMQKNEAADLCFEIRCLLSRTNDLSGGLSVCGGGVDTNRIIFTIYYSN